jgi:beta-phosphoglucomutase
MIKLVIFDMDGVLTSTTDEHFNAWAQLFLKYYQIKLDPKLEVKTKGVSRIDSLNVLLDHYQIVCDESVKQELATEKNEQYQQFISAYDESHRLPGIIRILDYLKHKDIKMALGSASKNGPFLLKALKIDAYFDYVVDPSLLKGKPNPDIFLDAAQHFNLDPKECMGVEDAVAGVLAIKRAGMIALGLGPEDLSLADHQVKTFPELTLEKLEDLLKGTL